MHAMFNFYKILVACFPGGKDAANIFNLLNIQVFFIFYYNEQYTQRWGYRDWGGPVRAVNWDAPAGWGSPES